MTHKIKINVNQLLGIQLGVATGILVVGSPPVQAGDNLALKCPRGDTMVWVDVVPSHIKTCPLYALTHDDLVTIHQRLCFTREKDIENLLRQINIEQERNGEELLTRAATVTIITFPRQKRQV